MDKTIAENKNKIAKHPAYYGKEEYSC